jgi:hypothetical protein
MATSVLRRAGDNYNIVAPSGLQLKSYRRTFSSFPKTVYEEEEEEEAMSFRPRQAD